MSCKLLKQKKCCYILFYKDKLQQLTKDHKKMYEENVDLKMKSPI